MVNVKPFSEIPSPSIAKLIFESLPGRKYANKSIMEMNQLFFEEYGNIVRIPSVLGNPEIVIAYKANDFERIYRNSGVYPERIGLQTLKYYRENVRPEIYSKYGDLATSQGEDWYNLRKFANQIVTHPKNILHYTQQIDEIAKEFVEIMKSLKDENNEMPGNFAEYINTWALETVATVVLEKRLNLLNGNSKDERAQKLIKYIRKFFEYLPKFELKVSIWRYYQAKDFKDLVQIFDNLTNIIQSYVYEAVEKFECEKNQGILQESMLRKLSEVDTNIAVVIISDLLAAGIDTTGTGILNTLYLLAKNHEKQEKLRTEIFKILPNKSSQMTPENIQNLPYLRACMKESYRMLPIVAGNMRTLKNDTILSGYLVPKNTYILLSIVQEHLNSKYYPEPDNFIPERWLKEKNFTACPMASESNPFSFLPFGHGARICIGKRIAELEIEVFIANIIRNFRLQWHYPNIKIKNALINIPDSEMKFKVFNL